MRYANVNLKLRRVVRILVRGEGESHLLHLKQIKLKEASRLGLAKYPIDGSCLGGAVPRVQ